jgi:hypothetical protein
MADVPAKLRANPVQENVVGYFCRVIANRRTNFVDSSKHMIGCVPKLFVSFTTKKMDSAHGFVAQPHTP